MFETTSPKVSIIILSYKNQRYIKGAIRSALLQDYTNFELIISDDCSGDFDKQRVLQFIKDEGIKSNLQKVEVFVMKSNLGTPKHANLIAQLSSGTYLKFLSADDELLDPFVISDFVKYMQKTQCIVATSLSIAYDESLSTPLYTFPDKKMMRLINSKSPKEIYGEMAIHGNFIGASGTFIRRDFFEKLGGFDETYQLTEDYPNWLRILRNGNAIPCYDRETTKYRTSGISSETNNNGDQKMKLRQELYMMYNDEFIPNKNLLTKFQSRYCQFMKEYLLQFTSLSLLNKLWFLVRFFDVAIFKGYHSIKRKMKRIL